MPSFNPGTAELARAKVNLTLCVRGRRPDGYHELASLVAFAGVGDTVAMEASPGGIPGRLSVGGPFAHGIAGENLLARTVALLRTACPHLSIGAVHLEKHLPVAAGLGGGSADVAALLRLVRSLNPRHADDVPWMEIAAQLGSDVPVCLGSRPALMHGRGERLSPVRSMPDLPAVLANPCLPLPTASVFAALGAGPAPFIPASPPAPSFAGLREVLDYMREHGNDLEPAAIGLLPAVAEVKARLAAEPGCLHAAMSGSGPTCFGIFASEAEARRAAAAMAAAKPAWWIVPTGLQGAPR